MERTFFTCCCCWQWLWQSRHRGIEWDSNGGHEQNLPFLRMVSQIARIPYTTTSQHYTFLCLMSSKSVNYFALGLFFLLLQITLVVPQCSLLMNAVKKIARKESQETHWSRSSSLHMCLFFDWFHFPWVFVFGPSVFVQHCASRRMAAIDQTLVSLPLSQAVLQCHTALQHHNIIINMTLIKFINNTIKYFINNINKINNIINIINITTLT